MNTDAKVSNHQVVAVTVLREQLGEAFHTALRKAGSSRHASEAHRAIREMNPSEWADILAFVIDGMPKQDAPDVR